MESFSKTKLKQTFKLNIFLRQSQDFGEKLELQTLRKI